MKKKHDEIVFLAKPKLNKIEVLMSKALINSNNDEFVLINNVLKEYGKMKKNIKNSRLEQFIKDFSLFIKQCYHIVWSGEKIQKVNTKKL